MEKDVRDDGVVILAFSFGSRGTWGNAFISFVAVKEGEIEKALAIITQEDILRRDSSFGPFFYVEGFMKENGWHSTLWVANAAKLFCLNKELPLRAIVVAAPMHLRRAMRDVKRIGFVVVRGVAPQIKSSWYEKKSSLPWTRSWWRWWSREIPLRLLPWWVYKRLTLKD